MTNEIANTVNLGESILDTSIEMESEYLSNRTVLAQMSNCTNSIMEQSVVSELQVVH